MSELVLMSPPGMCEVASRTGRCDQENASERGVQNLRGNKRVGV